MRKEGEGERRERKEGRGERGKQMWSLYVKLKGKLQNAT
jgi:hypothetical protein